MFAPVVAVVTPTPSALLTDPLSEPPANRWVRPT
jgi:hypothetical protein